MQSLTYKRALFLLGIVAVLGLGIGVGIGIVGGFNDSPQSSDPAKTSSRNTENQSPTDSQTEDANDKSATNSEDTNPSENSTEQTVPDEIIRSIAAKMKNRIEDSIWDRIGPNASKTVAWANRSLCGRGCKATSDHLSDIYERWNDDNQVKMPDKSKIQNSNVYLDDSFTFYPESANDNARGEAFGAVRLSPPRGDREKWGYEVLYLQWDVPEYTYWPGGSFPEWAKKGNRYILEPTKRAIGKPTIKINEPIKSESYNMTGGLPAGVSNVFSEDAKFTAGEKLRLEWEVDDLNPEGRLDVWILPPDGEWEKIQTTQPESGSLEWTIPSDWKEGATTIGIGNLTNPQGDTHDEQYEVWVEIKVQVL